MTTYPDSAQGALGSDGAFEIGGGSYDYGQTYNESVIRGMYMPQVPTPFNAIGLLEQQLSKLPLEALQFFKDLIPDWIEGAFDTVGGAVSAILGSLGTSVTEGLKFVVNGVQSVVNQVMDILGGFIVTPINAAVQAVKDWWNAITGGLGNVVNQVVDGFKGLVNGWHGGTTAAGTAEEVAATAVAIREAVVNGYTILTFTSSDPAYKFPTKPVSALGIAIGGGGRGGTGGFSTTGLAPGGLGGASGGYIARQLDFTGLDLAVATLNITVGAASSTPGAFGQQSSIVASTGVLLTSIPNGNGIANQLGYSGTTSVPGKGGQGGTANASNGAATAGTSGEASAIAPGGVGGLDWGGLGSGGNTGKPGQNGAAGDATSDVKCGGGGGGGGGGIASTSFAASLLGGAGGNGGFPGGGSGGGGAAADQASVNPGGGGPPGIPANGLVVIMYK